MRKSTNNLAGWLRLAAGLMVASVTWATVPTSQGPDAFGYRATNNAVYSFIDIASIGGSASVLAGMDDGTALVNLPFAFQFYGQSYNLVCVSANGILYLVPNAAACTSPADFNNTDLTAAAVPSGLAAMAPYWMDLAFQAGGSGAVYYQTEGTVGSREFIIEWYNALPQGSVSPVTFEVILNEGTNTFQFQYQTVDLPGDPANDGAEATIGIQAINGNINGQVLQWSYRVPVVTNGTAIAFTSFSPCDLNQDNVTNVRDVQAIMNEILGITPPLNDVNSDGVVNVVDLQIVMNATLNLGCVL